MLDKETEDTYVRAMFGHYAIQTPLNIIFQDTQEDALVGIIKARVSPSVIKRLFQGSRLTHHLFMGDGVLRPKMIVGSNHLRGVGMAGIMTCGDRIEDWVRQGKVILHNV